MTNSGKVQTIRQLTVTEWRDLITQEIELMLERKSRNCLGCMHFEDSSQLCTLAGAVPPPKIAVNGCEKFEEEIPF